MNHVTWPEETKKLTLFEKPSLPELLQAENIMIGKALAFFKKFLSLRFCEEKGERIGGLGVLVFRRIWTSEGLKDLESFKFVTLIQKPFTNLFLHPAEMKTSSPT